MKTISIYDTTLRDGSQSEDVSFTVEDKIRIAHKLDELGIKYIEGGWPGSNPKDMDFFSRVQNSNFQQAKITALDSTEEIHIFWVRARPAALDVFYSKFIEFMGNSDLVFNGKGDIFRLRTVS